MAYVTAPDLKTARAIAQTIVEKRLAACANVEGIDLRDATVAALQELDVVTRPLHEAFDLLPVLIDLVRHPF